MKDTVGLSPERQKLLEAMQKQSGIPGHTLLANTLARLGVTHVYGISGAPVDQTLAACGAAGIRVIGTRHQQAAAQAAAAHNQIADKLCAVVIVSSGPGFSNCVTGITVARDNHWPLLVIGGRRDIWLDTRGGFQSLDGSALLGSVTKRSLLVTATAQIPSALRTLHAFSRSTEAGPCYLDVTESALNGTAWSMTDESQWLLDPAMTSDVPGLESLLRASLLTSRRPVLIIGDGLRESSTFPLLSAIVERLGCPFITTPMAQGAVADSHPLCGTFDRAAVLAAADLVLLIGARLDWTLRFGAEIAHSASIVRVGFGDDPAVQERQGAFDVHGDPATAVRLLIDLVHASELSGEEAGWSEWRRGARQVRVSRRAAALADLALPLTPARMCSGIAQALPANCRTILDGNVCMTWAQHMLDVDVPQRRLTPGANGCMGIGLPFAMASCLAQPEVPVLVISGDFALGVSLQELETLVRYRLPVVILLARNGGNGGRLRQAAYWPEDHPDQVCTFSSAVRHDLLMQSMGGAGVRAETEAAIVAALQQAFKRPGPTLIEVPVRDDVLLPESVAE